MLALGEAVREYHGVKRSEVQIKGETAVQMSDYALGERLILRLKQSVKHKQKIRIVVVTFRWQVTACGKDGLADLC